ncbi:hypothetical protein [Paramesorhizobium deserti]|nr:hypothetical protein [Paramesorhizobium deserti]
MTDSTTDTTTPRLDGAHRGRRISWTEFYKLFPDLKPSNDNAKREQAA